MSLQQGLSGLPARGMRLLDRAGRESDAAAWLLNGGRSRCGHSQPLPEQQPWGIVPNQHGKMGSASKCSGTSSLPKVALMFVSCGPQTPVKEIREAPRSTLTC